MKILKRISAMNSLSLKIKAMSKRIALIPTMGVLHRGQLSLVDIAKKEADFVVVSIFVNPLQFGHGEDLHSYPTDLAHDIKLLKSSGVDALFAPGKDEMYPPGYDTYIEVQGLSSVLCGLSRPGHFNGVCTVVCKLFNIVTPDIAVFGEKDAQQSIIIKKMVNDLNLPIKIITGKTQRESDGLAMSSRNIYLSPKEREDAPILYQSLKLAKKLILSGKRDANRIKYKIRQLISTSPTARIDYIDIVSKCTLEPLKELTILAGDVGMCSKGKRASEIEILIALAVWFGKVRLIDNITLTI